MLGEGPGGLYRVRLMGQTVLAESRHPLTPGQGLSLTVESTSPQLVLSTAQAPGGGLKSLPVSLQMLLHGKERLAQNFSVFLEFDPPPQQKAALPPRILELAGELKETLREAALGPNTSTGPHGLARLIEKSGMDLESRLAASAGKGKAAALPGSIRYLAGMLAAELETHLAAMLGKDPEQTALMRELLGASQGLAGLFESNQRLNAELLPQRDSLFFALPLLLGDKLEHGELLLELPSGKERGQGKGQTRLAFLLNLTHLGPLAIQAMVAPGRVNGEFITDSPGKAEFLQSRLPELERALSGLGFEASFTVSLKTPAQVQSCSPLAEIIRQGGQYLSLTV